MLTFLGSIPDYTVVAIAIGDAVGVPVPNDISEAFRGLRAVDATCATNVIGIYIHYDRYL